MDDFNVPIMTSNGFNASSNIHTHHHKDHMLGGRSTIAPPFMYDGANRTEISTPKSDYAAFTNCIQQSALLDHRTIDNNMDGVSLSSLCDLKFSSPTLTTDTSFKNISLMGNIEPNHIMATKNSTQNMENNSNDINTEPSPSFTDLFQLSRHNVNIDPKIIQNCETTQSTHYLNLKPTESADNFLQNTTSTTIAPRICEPHIIGFNNSTVTTTASISHKQDTQNISNNNTSNTASVYQLCNKIVQFDNLEINNVECIPTSNQTENQISTTTTITSTANKINNNITTAKSNIETVEKITANTGNTSLPTIPSTCSSSCSSKISQEEPNSNHHQSSPNLSSDCDSVSSSGEFIDMEINERAAGYQDNTSSHSQQSANGGGGSGGGGGGGGTNTSNSAAGVALLNGGVGGGNTNAAGGYMSLLPPAVGNPSGHHLGATTGGTSATAGGSNEGGIDFKHLFEELCPVCGDKVSGYHYGLLTCESCKGFFKRTVQNKKVYTCVAERSCHIDKTQRKRCPYCRFQKCLEVGMKLEAVRADRMRGGRNKFGPMYKRDRARKLQVMRQRQLALQALRTSIGSADMKASPLSPGYQQAYPNMNIKQEIQIPQVSSLTQSPDSSPSPIAIALGQVNASTGVITAPMNGNSGTGTGGGGGNNSNNNSNNSDCLNRGGGGSCHDTGTGSLQNTGESKLCFDSGTHPSSTADSIIEPLRVSPMIREFVQSIDDREWQTQLFALLQKQTYNQVEVDLFELMCKVLDQNLFSQVDWARNTIFFKDLKVDDQMKLLQHSWSDMLVLDHLHQRIHNGLPDETQLNNGQVFNLLGLGLLGVPQLADYFNELQNKLQDLKFDMGDYVCMKFLILLNPDVRGIINKKTVLEGHENVQAALLDYTLTCYPSVTDKFRRLLNILPDIHAMAARGEEHLYSKHCAGSAPTQTLLMEMLHAKRKV